MVRSQANVRLFLTIGPTIPCVQSHSNTLQGHDAPDEGVNFCGLHVVQLLHRVLDLTLV